MRWVKARFLGYGVLIGAAGIKFLSSEKAKKFYSKIKEAAKHGKDEVLKKSEQENREETAVEVKEVSEEEKKEELNEKVEEAEVSEPDEAKQE